VEMLDTLLAREAIDAVLRRIGEARNAIVLIDRSETDEEEV
jgi:hypothetical protein